MNILNKIKITLMFFSMFVVSVANAGMVTAKTFDDVTEDAWYFQYVEQLAEEGIAEVGETYRPDDALTRGELAQMVIKAVDGLAEFEAPSMPTFYDVTADSPYYPYVEAAFSLGIVGGYTNTEGSTTGMFGPGDTVNRAAATKILSEAFDLELRSDAESIFPDVSKGAWFHDYVMSAYRYSVLDGYDNGFFGPADSVTRAQIAKLVVNAKNPVERITENETETEQLEDLALEFIGGGLAVTLNAVQSPPLTIPVASSAPLLNLDFTATDGAVYISEIALTRGGVGIAEDWHSIYLYDGILKITSEYAVNRDTNRVIIPTHLFVEPGTTKNILVYGSSAVAARPLDQHYFTLDSAADITSDAISVVGDFPLTGHLVTIGSQLTNTLAIVPGPSLSKPERDRQSEIASFKLTAGASSDVAVKALFLTQGGSFSPSKMTDCSLLKSGSEVVATAPGFYGEKLAFLPEIPFVIPSGQSRIYYVKCYVDGGRSTDSIQLFLDQTYDLITVNLDYGFSAVPLNYYTNSLAPSTTLKPAEIIIH